MKLINRAFLKIKWLLRKNNFVPDIIEKRKVIEALRESNQLTTLVETGTFLGDTVEAFKDKFDRIISIELSEELAAKARLRFANTPHITIEQGDSGIVLKKLLASIDGPVLFWLDGHYSSEFFIGKEFIKTAKGEKNTPIEKELDIIFQAALPSVILIDDARLFTGNDDYPTIKQIEMQVKHYRPEARVFVKTDIIHII